jgi:hypothetical protein
MTRDQIINRVNNILKIANNMADKTNEYNISNIVICCEGYAEPGYYSDNNIIAIGNWNGEISKRVKSIFEKMNVECEWEDEWVTCSNCGKAVRTQPDSYGWKASFSIEDGEINCVNCLIDNAEDYLKSLENNWHKANTISKINPTDYNYVKLDHKYATGFYDGQTDDPEKIAKSLLANGVERFLFHIDGVGQFDVHYFVFVHNSEIDLIE